MLSLSLLQVRTLLPWVMTRTLNRARHECHELVIQLPTIIKVRLLGTRRQSGTVTVPGTVPDLAGDGDAPPSPSPTASVFQVVRNPSRGLGDSPPSPSPISRGRVRRSGSPVPDSHRGVRALVGGRAAGRAWGIESHREQLSYLGPSQCQWATASGTGTAQATEPRVTVTSTMAGARVDRSDSGRAARGPAACLRLTRRGWPLSQLSFSVNPGQLQVQVELEGDCPAGAPVDG
jgi:hypothetical protein